MNKLAILLFFLTLSAQAADFTISVQPAPGAADKKTEVVEITCSQVIGASNLHRQIGSWVDSVDNTSFYSFGGCCSLNLKAGHFSGTPYCTINNSATIGGAGGECPGCNVWNRSPTKVDICTNGNGQRLTVVCIGQ